jgi:hypothetical protein
MLMQISFKFKFRGTILVFSQSQLIYEQLFGYFLFYELSCIIIFIYIIPLN